MMLEAIFGACVVGLALLGTLRGGRRVQASLLGMLAAGAAAWLIAVRLLPVQGLPDQVVLAGAALGTGLVVAALFGVVLRIGGRPVSWRGRLGGAVLGAMQGGALALGVVMTIGTVRPEAIEPARTSPLYPPVQAASVRMAGAGLPAPLAPAALPPAITPAVVTVAPPPRPVYWDRARDAGQDGARVFTGTVEAGARPALGFELPGEVVEIAVEVGQLVDAGQVLARLDPVALDLQVREARAALTDALARFDEARKDHARQSTLRDRGVVAVAVADRSEAALRSARSQADLALASLQRVADQRDAATLRAPFDGRIADQMVEVAQVVQAGQAVLTIEARGTPVEVTVQVPEAIEARLSVGQEHRVETGAGPLPARIAEIGTRPPGRSTFPITLRIEGGASVPRPGITARVRLSLPRANRPGVLVPASAVRAEAGQAARVFVYDGADAYQGILRAVSVDVLAYDEDDARVSGALAPGTIVATRGTAFLEDGMRVALMGEGIARFEE